MSADRNFIAHFRRVVAIWQQAPNASPLARYLVEEALRITLGRRAPDDPQETPEA